MQRKLVLATQNKDKARELAALTADLNLEILLSDAFPGIGDIAETGEMLEENALIKARAVFRVAGLPSLADDSGLEVHYLGGSPGVLSSRFSGPDATYDSNCRKLLDAMLGVPPRRRNARFRCVLAFVTADGEQMVDGIVRGTISEDPRGSRGFGYDPLFVPEGSHLTFAEMLPEEKNRISHRAKALQKMKPVLDEYFRGQG